MEGLSNLGIDIKSILFYIINIGLFVLLLWYFLYEPVINILSARQQKISDTIDEANKIKAEFEKKFNEMTEEQLQVQARLKDEVEQMEKFIESQKQAMLEEVEAEKQAILNRTAEEIERRKAQLVSDAEKELLKIIQNIVLEIVQNKVPTETVQTSVQEAWSKYSK
jgi:F-type H+-transporting ATPase subunit b